MDAKTQNKLQALHAEYTRKLPNKIQLLSEMWLSLSQKMTPEGMQEFHRAIHTLCGSSGTYGYHELSACARLLEIYLKDVIDKKQMDRDEIIKINELMNELTAVFLKSTQSLSKIYLSKDSKQIRHDKLVYILKKDGKFVSEVKKNLDSMGYVAMLFSEVKSFNKAIEKSLPGALIVDTDYLDESEITLLQDSHQQETPVPLFCISSQGDLLTRLKAIRAGSAAFFLTSNEAFYLTKTLDQMCSSSADEPLRILIVDDEPSMAEYYSVILQAAGMDVRYITNPLHMLDVLNDFRPDLLILDIYMPECSGLELAAVLRQESIYAGIPIIFLSTEDDRFKQLAALNIGGDDFLTKPILPQHLVAAVRSRAKRAGILSSYMIRDSLTGLLNHTNILQHLDIEISRASRLKSTLCFIMIDIDHFKLVNDTYGHSTGDHVIRKLSELLLRRLRKTDLVGRYGGEEFVVILPNTTPDIAIALCAHIREMFAQHVFKAENGNEFTATFSAGIAMYPDFSDAKSLIEAADQALYQAKDQGRNREVFLKF